MRKLLSLILVMTMVLSLCCFGTAYAEEQKPAAETTEQAETVKAAAGEDKAEEADEFGPAQGLVDLKGDLRPSGKYQHVFHISHGFLLPCCGAASFLQ